MRQKVLIVLATGFEEIEAITPMDVLRRAGLDVVTAGISGQQIAGAHGIQIVTDKRIEDCVDCTELPGMIVLPGGLPGADNLHRSSPLSKLLLKMHAEKRWIAAICASPAVVLNPLGILDGKTATCYPGFESQFGERVMFSDELVLVDGHVITSRGPGTAFAFSLTLVTLLKDQQTADGLRQGMLV